jgi:hypothetical protein
MAVLSICDNTHGKERTTMTKTLRIPNEPRFVRALALAVDPGDTLGLLMEIGALGSPDDSPSLATRIAIVRRTREALIQAYDQASDLKDWEQVHTVSVLREALAQGDGAAYLAYHAGGSHAAAEYAEALTVIGCAADTLGLRRRPWEIESNDLPLPEWRERVWRLLRESIPGNALPQPADQHASASAELAANDSGSRRARSEEQPSSCSVPDHSEEGGDET